MNTAQQERQDPTTVVFGEQGEKTSITHTNINKRELWFR